MKEPSLRILVVDDIPQNLVAMRALLSDGGVEVMCAASGPAALELLLKHDTALALLDVQMPGMDGYTLAELMRGAERTRHVPIIFLTAGAQEEQRSFRGYERGAVDFLYKPVDPRVLRSKVAVFVDLHRQRQQLTERMKDLQRVSRLNSMMLATLSHDLRSPLMALQLNAEMLMRRPDASVQRSGQRIKAVTTMLARQVDHLVNFARLPSDALRPNLMRGDLGMLVADRVAATVNQALVTTPFQYPSTSGDAMADFDPTLMSDAIDHLLLQAAIHAGDDQVLVKVDTHSRSALLLRISFDTVLPKTIADHLFGRASERKDRVDGATTNPSVARTDETRPTGASSSPADHPMLSTGGSVGLIVPERIARAHGGSLIGHSHDGEGTLFELMLPRASTQDAAAPVEAG